MSEFNSLPDVTSVENGDDTCIEPDSVDVSDSEKVSSIDPIVDIIDYLVRIDGVIFKSQQSGDENMSKKQKKTIATDIYRRSKSAFLARFGEFLKPEHLNYFKSLDLKDDSEGYEVSFYLNRLQRYHSCAARKKDVKNRRFQALQKLLKDGVYFSEKEMMLRNPLLYDHLIGQYLSEGEIKARDNIDTTNITFVGLLMEKIDRDHFKAIRQQQEDAEECQVEEDEDDEDDQEVKDDRPSTSEFKSSSRWGEFDDKRDDEEETLKKPPLKDVFISASEKKLFREEFLQEMYSSFLEGRDTDFDYESVDGNQDYDNIEIIARDEEESYFNSESPESEKEIQNESIERSNRLDDIKDSESEDELEIYMKHLSRHHSLVSHQ